MSYLATELKFGNAVHQSGKPEQQTRSTSSPHQAVIVLPAQGAWVASARHITSAVLREWGITEEDQAPAVLVIGELAANAAQYGGSQMIVHISLSSKKLYLMVIDEGTASNPHPADRDPVEHGRGLGIVTSLADQVQERRHDTGREVRAVLRLSAPDKQLAS